MQTVACLWSTDFSCSFTANVNILYWTMHLSCSQQWAPHPGISHGIESRRVLRCSLCKTYRSSRVDWQKTSCKERCNTKYRSQMTSDRGCTWRTTGVSGKLGLVCHHIIAGLGNWYAVSTSAQNNRQYRLFSYLQPAPGCPNQQFAGTAGSGENIAVAMKQRI